MKNAILLLLALVCIEYAKAQPCSAFSESILLDANNVRTSFAQPGYLWTKPDTSTPPDYHGTGYEVPKTNSPQGQKVSSIFTGGLWFSAKDQNDSIRVSRTLYHKPDFEEELTNFIPGPIDSTGNALTSRCNVYNHYWKIEKEDIEKQINNYRLSRNNPIPINTIPQSVLEWPAIGNPFAKGKDGQNISVKEELAPFVDVDSNGLYNPMYGDFPKVEGDQHIFWVYNDKPNRDTAHSGPMGIEIRANAFAFKSNKPSINNATFYKFSVHAKDTFELHNMHVSIWVDIDLGCFNNDYVGCDTARDMGIGYNGTPTDPDCATKGYQANPPILGVKILKGLHSENESPINPAMSGFVTYINVGITGHPDFPNEYYLMMNGHWKDGTPITYGNNGYGGSTIFPYMYNGNPADPNQWSECSVNNPPGDRKFVMNMGPIDLMPGESTSFHFAVVWTRPDSFHCRDFNTTIGKTADEAQAFYDSVICKPKEIPVASTTASRSKDHLFTVYPNPFQNLLYCQFTSFKADANTTLVLQSVDGKVREIFNEIEKDQLLIATQNLPTGLYYLSLYQNNKVIQTKKLIKVKSTY